MSTAPAPAKSQPLHNFSLPHLGWGHKSNHASSSSHRFRRRDSPSPELQHQHCDGGETDDNVSASTTATTKLQTGPRTARNHHHHQQQQRFSFSPCTKQQKPQQEQNAVVSGGDHAEDKEPTWNLRPRKQVNFLSETVSFADIERVERNAENNGEGRSLRLRGGHGDGTGPARPKSKPEPGPRKLWISLSREEIDEDVYALTGSRPSRRPKKRPKTVQKLVDNVFPGMYMAGATADFYRVHEILEVLEIMLHFDASCGSHTWWTRFLWSDLKLRSNLRQVERQLTQRDAYAAGLLLMLCYYSLPYERSSRNTNRGAALLPPLKNVLSNLS